MSFAKLDKSVVENNSTLGKNKQRIEQIKTKRQYNSLNSLLSKKH